MFETAVQRLEDLSGRSMPALAQGGKNFFSSATSWLGGRMTAGTAVVFADPSYNLATPYPRDELSMALALSSSHAGPTEVHALANSFGLTPDLLDRPILNLSGGERMLVSLCKAAALAPRTRLAILCSPYFWLDINNRARVGQVLELLVGPSTSSHLLLLLGENDSERAPRGVTVQEPPPLSWTLGLRDLTVCYPGSTFPRRTHPKIIRFAAADQRLSLSSPTLLRGPNGIGKTTLAKLLAGLKGNTTGSASIVSGGYSGYARLQLQDPLLHLFAQTPEAHLWRVFACSKDARKEALALFGALQDECAEALAGQVPGASVGARESPTTVLQAKLALAAERLIARPPLLILDEPGWCLSKPVALAYLRAVTRAAHQRGTAILIISHQAEWWEPLATDAIVMEKRGDTVQLRKETID